MVSLASLKFVSTNNVEFDHSERKPDRNQSFADQSYEKTSRRFRSFSSDDAHVSNIYGLNSIQGGYVGSSEAHTLSYNNGLSLSLKMDASPLLVLILESIMCKYDVDESDFDDFEVDWSSDKNVEIEELFNLVLFAWNLEESFEEKEKTDSFKEYFELLEQFTQAKTCQVRSKSTGYYDLQPKICSQEMLGSRNEKHTETIQRSTATSKEKPRNEMNNNGLSDKATKDRSCENDTKTSVKQIDSEQQNKEGQNITSNPIKHREIDLSDRGKASVSVLNTRDVAMKNVDSKRQHFNQALKPIGQSFNMDMVSLATPVWSHDHTYCLTTLPIKIPDFENGVPIVTAESCTNGIEVKLSESRDVTNMETLLQSDVTVDDNGETRDTTPTLTVSNETLQIPNKEHTPKAEGSVAIDNMAFCDSTQNCNIQNKEVSSRVEGRVATDNMKTRDSNDVGGIPNEETFLKADNREITNSQLLDDDNQKDKSKASEEQESNDCDKPSIVQKKKLRRADNTVAGEESGSPESTNPRGNSCSGKDTISPNSKTTPTSNKAKSYNLRSPLRSKRTRIPARRRLDTHYY